MGSDGYPLPLEEKENAMRKIERKMVEAIRTGKAFSGSNTRVVPLVGGGFAVSLHGNQIAYAAGRKPDGTVWGVALTDAGWKTATTKSRLNAILHAIGETKVIYQKRDEWTVYDYENKSSFPFGRGVEIMSPRGLELATI